MPTENVERTVLKLFNQYQCEVIEPVKVRFACILKPCSNIRFTEKGRTAHMQIQNHGFESDTHENVHLYTGMRNEEVYKMHKECSMKNK